jgi:DNA-binding NarL/FixJ family response regulator
MFIQIVDDSPNMRATIKSILGDSGATFIESGNGEDAVQQYREIRPDLILMDIRMERVDGIAATRAIRAIDPGARIIIVTQYDDDDLRNAAREAGAEGYVLKDDLSALHLHIH